MTSAQDPSADPSGISADLIHNGNPYFEGKPASIVREYPMQLHAIGPDGHLRLGAAFDLMQDIAGVHAALLGVGIHDLRRLGITWVLSRLMLKYDALPPCTDSVRVKTWPSGVHRLFAMRQFELSDPASGQRIATASSYWLMLKLSNLRPVSPDDVTGTFPANPDKPIFFEDWGKLDPSPGSAPVSTVIGQSKIDYNDHVNNAHYPMFAQDWIAARLGYPVRLGAIRVNFNFALRLFETIVCTGELDGNSFRVVGHTPEGKNVFASDGTFAPMEIAER
jgi:acyl-ACP thioesterase